MRSTRLSRRRFSDFCMRRTERKQRKNIDLVSLKGLKNLNIKIPFFAQKKEVQEYFKTEEYFEALTPKLGSNCSDGRSPVIETRGLEPHGVAI